MFDISLSEEGSDCAECDPVGLCKTYCIEVTGDRFLYKQVRFMVGTIIQYATKEVTKEELEEILASKKWVESANSQLSLQRFCAPAHGLGLTAVEFNENWAFEWLVNST